MTVGATNLPRRWSGSSAKGAIPLLLLMAVIATGSQAFRYVGNAAQGANGAGPFETYVTDGCYPVVSRQGWVYFGRVPTRGESGAAGQDPARDDLLTLWTCMFDGGGQRRVRLNPPQIFFWVAHGILFPSDPSRCYMTYLPNNYKLDYWDRFGEFSLLQQDVLQTRRANTPAAGEAGYSFISPDETLCLHYLVGPGHLWELSRLDPSGECRDNLWGPIMLHTGEWSSDSRRFAFVPSKHGDFHVGGDRLGATPGGEIFVLNVQLRAVTDTYSLPGIEVKFLSWSPDGTWLSIWGNVLGERPRWTVTLLELSTARVWQFGRCDSDPSWSPDGKWLVYSRSPGGRAGERIYRLNWRRAVASSHPSTRAVHTTIAVP